MSTDIALLFGTPSRAQLIIDEGEIVLVIAQHEHRWKMTVEGHVLGVHVDIDELLHLLGTLGLDAPGLRCTVEHAAPTEPVAPAALVVCPDCGERFKPAGLKIHRFKKHLKQQAVDDIPAAAAVEPAPISLVPEPGTKQERTPQEKCEICGVSWKIHERCEACGIGVGEHHATKYLLEGRCTDCIRAARLRLEQAA